MTGAIYIAGPTASGKSAVALLAADQLQGEIISVDSMQVYRGLDIGTAKPTAEERARVRHHLIDIVEVSEPFDVARFVGLARQIVKEIHGRGRLPIFCGGTGLYFNALVGGVGESPAGDSELRAQLEATPIPALLDELAKSDPETFARIDRSNSRRVVRAVEVIRLSGRPFAAQRSDWQYTKLAAAGGLWIGLARGRPELNRRIDERVDSMFAAGLVDETRGLLGRGLEGNRTAMQAIGYRQVVEHLRGERDLPATVDLVRLKTRQYAKRQMTWFRRQLNLNWLEVQEATSSEEIASEIVSRYRRWEDQPPATI